MFCRNCGRSLNPGVRFCNGCGAPVGAPQVQEAVSHRCESCGAMMRQIAPNRFICDYCGSQWAESQPVQPVQQPYQPAPPPASTERQVKDMGEEFLDDIYSAVKKLFK